VAWRNLVRAMWLDHLLWIHDDILAIWPWSRNHGLHVLHLSSAYSISLPVRPKDSSLCRIHDAFGWQSLHLLLNILLHTRWERGIIWLSHGWDTLTIGLLNVHRVARMLWHALFDLLISPSSALSLIRHLLDLSVLRLPLSL
jgi:hypothetical protein